ncbi:LysE family transporter [Paenibacillus sp. IHBB 10380]|uniref:LysE family transporter n=1 Tax=Paenibacillus sp. IHBB 10380 TaxID=1566358 RepID=UPI0005CFA6E6|nr:LysE family transporter [Paenibacillus sp. IHBB 10380]AJS58405.1 amino acid transporter [Paenibacillus sp. IHBB 10380]
MGILFGYIFLGISLSAPIGPINAAQLDAGIKKGFGHAWLVGLGAMVADILYMIMVYMGLVHFISVPFIQTFLWLFGSFVLIYTGIESLMGIGQVVDNRQNNRDTRFKSFSYGFLMSLTNPLTILFWLGIYGSVLVETASKYDAKHLLLYSFAIIFGIFIWDLIMASVASSARKWFTENTLKVISAISGLSLLGFGVYFGYKAVKILFFH